jgi:hypothetical protein
MRIWYYWHAPGLGAHSPDPFGNKLRSAAKAVSPNPDAKTLGLIPNNLAVNTRAS